MEGINCDLWQSTGTLLGVGEAGLCRPASRTLANLDLNLLVTLDALVQHQSVTRAAEQLGVTQPAVSAALRGSAGISGTNSSTVSATDLS